MESGVYQLFWETENDLWWWVALRQRVMDSLSRYLPNRGNNRLLDIGCGTGMMMKCLRKHGTVYGTDMEPLALEFTRKRNEELLCQGNVEHLPFYANSFDAVTVLDVLEHVADDAVALKEIHRILRPGGIAVINVPAFKCLWSGKDVQVKHLRRYRKQDLISIIPDGFRIRHISFWNTLLFLPIALTRLYQRKRGINPDLSKELKPNAVINNILKGLLLVERPLVSWPGLPFGVSLFCTLSKT